MSWETPEFRQKFEQVKAELTHGPLSSEEQVTLSHLMSIKTQAAKGNTIEVEKRRAHMLSGGGLTAEEQVVMRGLMSKKGKKLYEERKK